MENINKDDFKSSPSRRRESYISKNYPELYNELLSDKYNDFETFSDKINKFVFGGGYCVVCNIRTKKETGKPGFRECCSTKCAGINKQGISPVNKSVIDEDLVKEMYENNKSPKEIGEYFNVSNVTINKIIDKLEIKRSHREQLKIHSLKGMSPWNSNAFDKKKAYDLDYLKKENMTKSIASIAYKIGCSPSLLYQLFKANNIKVNNLTKTKPEILIHELLDEYNIEYIENYRDEKEIDIFIPEYKLGIEVNGVYWHCEKFRDSKYHINKTEFFESKGIRILHFWDYEIIDMYDIVSNIIKMKLNLIDVNILLDECDIRDVDTKSAKLFCDENHLQKFVGSTIKKGLYYNDSLVALAMFTNPRYYKNADYELTRFCIKKDYIVDGAFDKLIEHMNVYSIVCYLNKRYSIHSDYLTDKFKLLYDTQPNYFYYNVRNGEIKNKLSLKGNYKQLQKEHIYRVFDCGSGVFYKNKKSTS